MYVCVHFVILLQLPIYVLFHLYVWDVCANVFIMYIMYIVYIILYITVLLGYHLHAIKFTLLKHIIQQFLLYSQFFAFIPTTFRTFNYPKKKPCSRHFPCPHILSLIIIYLFSGSINLPILDILCKWSHITYVFFVSLASFTCHSVFKVHPIL